MHNKLYIGVGFILLLLFTIGFSIYDRHVSAKKNVQSEIMEGSARVVLKEGGYSPRILTVKKGTTITFESEIENPHWPASNLHPTHGIYPAFDPKQPIDPDETWSFTFNRLGSYNFHDHIRAYYVGTIHVVE